MEKLNHSSSLCSPILISELSHEGRGIAHINGKTTFIDNALPGESVLIAYTKKHRRYDEGQAIQILDASPERIQPKCPYYGTCGGCHLQHLDTGTQLRYKENALLEQLHHFGGIQPKALFDPISAKSWGYRRRARLGVKYVEKKKTVFIGFREKNGRYLTQLQTCETLDPKISQLLPYLQHLLSRLQAYQSIPQIEVALGDETLSLILRHLLPLEETDQFQLKTFAEYHQLQLYLQPGNTQTIHCIWPETNPKPLSYRLDNTGASPSSLELLFKPHHFIQINALINQAMVKRAVELLTPCVSDRILDLFCGLGNFSLPLATRCQSVIGVEGSYELSEQARINAMHNTISNAHFYQADLSVPTKNEKWAQQTFNKLLLDPPRSGALNVIRQTPHWSVERIVYISCNPASLARDAGELVKQGYSLQQIGIMDMFPQTRHSETICLFTK